MQHIEQQLLHPLGKMQPGERRKRKLAALFYQLRQCAQRKLKHLPLGLQGILAHQTKG
ncbi:hypothetical protein D3C75_1199340 [compost metagenome]